MKKISSLFILFFAFTKINAQQNVITTGVPFLLVAADARSAGMGDQGVATAADAFSQQWNPAKYAFARSKQAFTVNYTPYLTDIVNDIYLGQVNYYNRLDERSALAGSLRVFGLGGIDLREDADSEPRRVSPNELAVDLSYSLKLSEKFAMAVGARFINSNLKIPGPNGDASAASTFAVDVAGFFQSEEVAFNDFNGRWRAGFNFQNLGPKINYDNDQFSANFLPANLKLGGGFDFILDDYNKVSVSAEISKLLVPTPQVAYDGATFTGKDMDGDGMVDKDDLDLAREEYRTTSWTSGIFKSFGDAPGGFKEELKELTYSVGAEYLYQDSFAMRLGYFNENVDKGARKFLTLGAGFKYTTIKVDVSYLFSMGAVKNPLENTLRFSLSFNFGDEYDEY